MKIYFKIYIACFKIKIFSLQWPLNGGDEGDRSPMTFVSMFKS